MATRRCSWVGGERHGADHVGDRLAATAGRRGGQPLDLVLRAVHVRAGQRVPDQPLGDRADLAGQQPVQQRGLALARRRPVAQDAGQVVVAGHDPAEPEELVLDARRARRGRRRRPAPPRSRGSRSPRPGPADATSAAGPRSRGPPGCCRRPCAEAAGGPAPARSSGRTEASDSARRSDSWPSSSVRHGEQLVGEGQQRVAAAAAARAGPRVCSASRDGRARPALPPQRGPAGGLHQRCSRAPRPVAGGGMPSRSSRNRSTVPLRRASSASDSPTTRPARSTASVPI